MRHPGEASQLRGLVHDVAVECEQRHLLEADDVGVEGRDDRGDALEAGRIAPPPPPVGEWSRPDGGAYVEGRDPEAATFVDVAIVAHAAIVT